MIRAYLGGSFDPVHLGHLAMAHTVALNLDSQNIAHRTALLPSRNPFKHTRHSTDSDRIAMLTLALDEYNRHHHCHLALDRFELDFFVGDTATYTLNTLITLKDKYPDDTLIFIIGQDSLNTLPRWKGGLELFNFAHFWVFTRHNTVIDWEYQPFLVELPTLISKPCGGIYLDNTAVADISSTAIRQAIAQGNNNLNNNNPVNHTSPTSLMILPSVFEYITKHQLYLS